MRNVLISRRLFSGMLVSTGLAVPVSAETSSVQSQPPVSPSISEIENYLNGIHTLRANFDQIAPDGSSSSGTLAIERPGRMRLDYDPPSGILLIATGDWRLVFYDSSIKQVNIIPISQTPLGFLLDDQVRLSGDVKVVDHRSKGGEVGVTLVRTDEPNQGNVTLIFNASPIELRRWVVVDAQGQATYLILKNVQTGIKLDPELFRWRDPKVFGFPDDN